MVNESMVKHFGWKNAIGKRVTFPGDTSNHYLEVVGVVKDFNQKSLYNPIAPLLFFYSPNSNIIQVKLNPGNIPRSITQAETTWKKYFPQLPFEYKFLDEDFNSQYAADQKRGKIFAAFSILTIIIPVLACWDLLHLPPAKAERNQYTQGDGREHYTGGYLDHEELSMTGIYRGMYCISCCLVFHE